MVGMEKDSFEEMYSETLKNIEAGSIVKGKVVQILDDVVMVDVGYKSEGQIPISEFTDREGKLTVDVGDEVEVFLERLDGELGTVRLSRRKAERIRAWQEVLRAYEKGKPVYGVVESQVKGGFFVDLGGGLRAFLPYSHAALWSVKNDVESFIGRRFGFKVVKLDERKYNVVVSRKVFLEEEKKRRVEELMKELRVGAVLEGRVKSITSYGAFVDLGGLDGLLHISDMSYERIKHPSELLAVGDRINVMVKELSDDKKRISLSLKALKPDPWEKAREEISKGDRVRAIVRRVFDFGVLVSISSGVEGFIPVEEISWTKRVKPSDYVSPGDEVEAVVIGVDSGRRRFLLSLRQIMPNPWEKLDISEGDIVEGKVSGIADFGVFVEVGEGVEGLVHVSEVSWLERNPNLSKMFSVGDRLRVKVLKVDRENRRISLSIKALEENPWEVFRRENPPGSIVEGEVSGHADFGMFVKVNDVLEGLVHVKEIPKVRGKRFEEIYPVGSRIRVMVVDVDPSRGKVSLSIRKAEESEEKSIREKYTGQNGRTTLGSILEEKDPSTISLIKGV